MYTTKKKLQVFNFGTEFSTFDEHLAITGAILQTDRQTGRRTDRQAGAHAHTHTHTLSHSLTHTHTHTYTLTHTHTHILTHTHTTHLHLHLHLHCCLGPVVSLSDQKKCTLRSIAWSLDDSLIAAAGEDRVARCLPGAVELTKRRGGCLCMTESQPPRF